MLRHINHMHLTETYASRQSYKWSIQRFASSVHVHYARKKNHQKDNSGTGHWSWKHKRRSEARSSYFSSHVCVRHSHGNVRSICGEKSQAKGPVCYRLRCQPDVLMNLLRRNHLNTRFYNFVCIRWWAMVWHVWIIYILVLCLLNVHFCTIYLGI